MSGEKLFYIQDARSYSGNAIMWWKKGGQGYGADIREAETFTEAEIKKICTNDPDYKPHEKEYIDNLKEAQKLIIDMQYLRKKRGK